jgi:hypothetical protein
MQGIFYIGCARLGVVVSIKISKFIFALSKFKKILKSIKTDLSG